MKTARDCAYITPCGWCSRKNENCKELEEEKKRAEEKQKIKEKHSKNAFDVPWI